MSITHKPAPDRDRLRADIQHHALSGINFDRVLILSPILKQRKDAVDFARRHYRAQVEHTRKTLGIRPPTWT